MLSAEFAVLVHLKSVGVVLFDFHRVVVSLLALGAGKCDFYSHSFTPPVLRGAFARVFFMLVIRLYAKNLHIKKEP